MRDPEPEAEGKLCSDSWNTDILRYLFIQPPSFELIYYTAVDNNTLASILHMAFNYALLFVS